LSVGCDPPGKPKPEDRPIPADQIMTFDGLFQENCAGCHGATGKKGPAPLLNDGLFRTLISEKELEQVINQGRPGTPMSAFAIAQGGTLTPAQIQVLVHEIKGIPYRVVKMGSGVSATFEVVNDAKGIVPAWGAPKTSLTALPPYAYSESKAIRTSADFEAIRTSLFAKACAGCHGESGQGVKIKGKTLNRINEPAFLKLISKQALRRIIITGRPDLTSESFPMGMPTFAASDARANDYQPLTSEQINDLVDLLASWR
jgi:mono/diheme cytochrome c family protein